MMTALLIVVGVSMLSTLFILAALFAAKRVPQYDSAEAYATERHEVEVPAILVPSVRLAA